MTVGVLKEFIKGLPNDMDIVVKVNKYVNGNVDSGIIGHVSGYSMEDIEKWDFNSKEAILECTCMCD